MKPNKYDLNIKEEQLKNEVRDDFFYNFDTTKIIENIDLSVAVKSTNKNQGDVFEMPFLLFGEAKRGNKNDIIESFVQLILTYDIKKYFQGVSDKTGRVNSKSNDEKYNELLTTLKNNLQKLAQNIETKTYEYGFLMQ